MTSITVCNYKTSAKGKWKQGFAIVNGIGLSDVMNILNLEGKLEGSKVYDYRLSPEDAVMLHPMSLCIAEDMIRR